MIKSFFEPCKNPSTLTEKEKTQYFNVIKTFNIENSQKGKILDKKTISKENFDIVKLYLIDNISQTDIAKKYNITKNAVRDRINRVLRKVRALYK